MHKVVTAKQGHATLEFLNQLNSQLDQLNQNMQRPRKIVRDENGSISGVQ
jgi:flagellar biosynthesis chaperone FliJ